MRNNELVRMWKKAATA